MAQRKQERPTVADFFAGIGLVSLGLERAGWETVYALDYDDMKAESYAHHFGDEHYVTQDVNETQGADVPNVFLAHASFPCTNLSVAGDRKGINSGESSAFWPFVRILSEMSQEYGEGRPPLVMLENVEGLITSNDGRDLRSVISTLNDMGYVTDLLRIDASSFVPQSRVRIFIIGIHDSIAEHFDQDKFIQEHNLRSSDARSARIADFVGKNSDLRWYFHPLPNLPRSTTTLQDILTNDGEWWPKNRSDYLYSQLHAHHKEMVDQQMQQKQWRYYPAFRRTRVVDGMKRSMAELRTDGIAGCLRTPKGGSARQILIRVGNGRFDARLINAKEAARLMGADEFQLNPSHSLNQVLFGFGDAVCVPALEWIGSNYLNEILINPGITTKKRVVRLRSSAPASLPS